MERKTPGLNGTELKIIALVIMTIDHIGMLLFPQLRILRIIGRASFPIFAYMIAEGCRYTRDPVRYWLRISAVALVCQTVYFFVMHSLDMCIFVSFMISVPLVLAVQRADGSKRSLVRAAALIALSGVISLYLPQLIPGFRIDYGFFGIMLPVLTALGKNRRERLLFCAVGLGLLSISLGGIQKWCFAALLPLAFYNGERGAHPMKNLFYLYYPLHLAALQLISELIK